MSRIIFKVQASKKQFHVFLALSGVLAAFCLLLGYEAIAGRPSWEELFVLSVLAAVSIIYTIRLKTTIVFTDDGQLMQKNLFVNQKVLLTSLVRAERYTTAPAYTDPRLKLVDKNGNVLILCPGEFTIKDLDDLLAVIGPFIFIASVDKNFMDLYFYQGQNTPRLG